MTGGLVIGSNKVYVICDNSTRQTYYFSTNEILIRQKGKIKKNLTALKTRSCFLHQFIDWFYHCRSNFYLFNTIQSENFIRC